MGFTSRLFETSLPLYAACGLGINIFCRVWYRYDALPGLVVKMVMAAFHPIKRPPVVFNQFY
jgi:hypothetical protein